MSNKKYTQEEGEYLLRVSRKVPVEVVAKQLKRTRGSVMFYCCKHGISMRVPNSVMLKNYPEILKQRKKNKNREKSKCDRTSA